MNKMFLSLILLGVMPLVSMAQDDDVYFTPKKTEKTEISNIQTTKEQPTYYAGSQRNVDEYNRKGNFWSHYQKIGTDKNGNDIIEFRKGNGVYPDSIYIDTTFVGRYSDTILDDEEDYRYSARLGMWDDFYAPWMYSYRMNSPYYWHRYYGMNPWYDPWYYSRWGSYYGWYDPWYYSNWYGYGWGYPYYGGYWGGGYWPYHRGYIARQNTSAGVRSYSFGNRGGNYQSSNGRVFSSRGSNRSVNTRRNSYDNGYNNVYQGRNGAFSGRNENSTRSYTPSSSFPSGGSFGSRGGSSSGGSFGGGRSGGSFGGGGGRFGHR